VQTDACASDVSAPASGRRSVTAFTASTTPSTVVSAAAVASAVRLAPAAPIRAKLSPVWAVCPSSVLTFVRSPSLSIPSVRPSVVSGR
jgi:hypothetical protein